MSQITPALTATALYGVLCGLLHIWLGLSVGAARAKLKIFMGDGGDPYMIRVMRGQLNFVENVPLALGMLVIAALLGLPAWAVHILGITLVVGRILHGIHFTRRDAPGWQRMVGTLLTTSVQAVLILALLTFSFGGIV